jgi:hypothetical protein
MTTSTKTASSSTDYKNIDLIANCLGHWVELEQQRDLATLEWFDTLKSFYMVNGFASMGECIDTALFQAGFATSATAKLSKDSLKVPSNERCAIHYDIQDGFKFINPAKALGKSGVEVMNSVIRSVDTGKKGKIEPKDITAFTTYAELKAYYNSVKVKPSTDASGKGKKDDEGLTMTQAISFISQSLPEVARLAQLLESVRGTQGYEDLNRILKSIQPEPVYPAKPEEPAVAIEWNDAVVVDVNDVVTGLSPLHYEIIKECEQELALMHGQPIDLDYAIGLELFIEYIALTIDEPNHAIEFKGLIMDAMRDDDMVRDAIKYTASAQGNLV